MNLMILARTATMDGGLKELDDSKKSSKNHHYMLLVIDGSPADRYVKLTDIVHAS